MPILSTDRSGAGPLYTFDPADPYVLLTDTADYFETGGRWAVEMAVADATFHIDGTIVSTNIAILDRGSGTTDIVVGATGHVSGSGAGLVIAAAHRLNLSNSGTIESVDGIAINASGTGASGARISNDGLIRGEAGGVAIRLGIGSDIVVNTGRIVGDVVLGDGVNRIDTRFGTITGEIVGGNSTDYYIVAGDETIVEEFSGGNDRVTAYSDFILPINVESLVLAGTARIGVGNGSDNTIYGNALGNRLSGLNGFDYIETMAGDDVVKGGAGDDLLTDYGGDNILDGGSGADTIYLSGEGNANSIYGRAGDDSITIRSGVGSSLVYGGSGVDTLKYELAATLVVDLAAGTIDIDGVGVDRIFAIERLVTGAGSDTIDGSARGDFVSASFGNDVLRGLAGDDVLEGGAGADTIEGGTGKDTAVFGRDTGINISYNLTTGVGNGDAVGDVLTGIENLRYAGGLFGTLTGDAQNNRIDTLGGYLVAYGMDGNDILMGGGSPDGLSGDAGNDTLFGAGGGDDLIGGAGRDVLDGGAGDDAMSGGAGGDTFVFGAIAGQADWGTDEIRDFEDGIDKIDLRGATGIDSFDDLLIVANGSGGVVIGTALGGIRLLDTAIGEIDETDFLFAVAAEAPFARPAHPLANDGTMLV